MKALLINAEDRSVVETEIKDWMEIAPRIRCHTFACPFVLANEDTLYVDDEGLLTDPQNFFVIDGAPQPYAGSGLLLGCDDEGESVDVKTTVAELADMVKFYDINEIRLMVRNGQLSGV